jgi:hypothetical protein
MFLRKHPGYFIINNSIHNHLTRRNADVHVVGDSLSLNNMNPMHAVATIYNALPPDIKRLERLMSFKTSLTKFLLDKCFYAIYPDCYTINNDKPTYLCKSVLSVL